MKEQKLRGMIRKEIKSSLKEATTSQVDTSLDRVEKMAGIKMLKKALGQGTPMQQASGLLSVVKAISGENPTVAKTLARLLMKKGIGSDEPVSSAEPSAEPTMENKALDARMAKLDTTQQLKMLKQALATKPAATQGDFVINMLKNLDLKDAAKQRLFLKMRKELKN